MAPEQWIYSEVGKAADGYSLGVVAFEALSGRPPFEASTSDEYEQLHRQGEVPRLGVPDIDAIIQRAMAKHPESRHESVIELAREFEAAQHAIGREHLRSSSEKWEQRGRPRRLLWSQSVIADFERTRTQEILTTLQFEFLEASKRQAQMTSRRRKLLAAIAVLGAIAIPLYRASEQARAAREQVAAVQIQAELDLGHEALVQRRTDALPHLTAAYKGDPSSAAGFMLARELDSRLAEQAALPGKQGQVWSASFSPDGQRILTTDEASARLWDVETHSLLREYPHPDVVYHAVFGANGTQFYTACGDGIVRRWNTGNDHAPKEFQPKQSGHSSELVALSPDEKLIASVNSDGGASVWDAATGALLATLPTGRSTDMPSLTFSGDGQFLAASTGYDAYIFRTTTWESVTTIPGPNVNSIVWDPHSQHVLTGSATGEVALWSIPEGTRTDNLLGVSSSVEAVAFSPDGRLAAAACSDGTELVWNADGAGLRHKSNWLRSRIRSLEFDHSSSRLVASSSNGKVAVTEVEHGLPLAILGGPRGVVIDAHFNAAATHVVGASWDGSARVWSTAPQYLRWVSSYGNNHCGRITSLEPDRPVIAVSCEDQSTIVWDTTKGDQLAKLPGVTPTEGTRRSAYPAVSSDGLRAAIARFQNVEIYELPSGRRLDTVRHDAAVSSVAFAPAGHDLITGAIDGSVLVTREDGARLTLPPVLGSVDALRILSTGQLVVATDQHRLRFYGNDGALLADLETNTRVQTMRASTDGHRLVTLSSISNQTASPQLWDSEHHQRIADLAPQGTVYAARFIGSKILTTSVDGAVRLWDGKDLVQTYRAGTSIPIDATMTSDGTLVIAGEGDGSVQFWTATGFPLWSLQVDRDAASVVGVRVDGDDLVTRSLSGNVARWRLPAADRVIELGVKHGMLAR